MTGISFPAHASLLRPCHQSNLDQCQSSCCQKLCGMQQYLLVEVHSTDNFAVGASLGISNKPLSSPANAVISFLNAFGAYVSASGGHLLGELAPFFATLFAALIFAYLSIDEFTSNIRNQCKNEGPSTMTMGSGSLRDALRIAIPMTLNNLAGGAAGGAVGINAITSGVLALVASFSMMKLGHVIGKRLKASVGDKISIGVVSGTIFACLAIIQLAQ